MDSKNSTLDYGVINTLGLTNPLLPKKQIDLTENQELTEKVTQDKV